MAGLRTCLSICLLACVFFPRAALSRPARIALLSEAQIPGDSILLGDLLPLDVPARVRALADSILLGKTPQSGTARYLRAPMIAEAIERAGASAAGFEIPDVIAVQRHDRPLDAEEILVNLRVAMPRFSLSAREEEALLGVQSSDVVWDAALRVPLGPARLQVQEVQADLSAGRLEARMAVETPGNAITFAVFASLAHAPLAEISAAQAPGTAFQVHLASRGSVASSHANDAPEAPVLIATGHFAQMYLHSANSSIVLQVQALQAGHAGETIRVRLPATGKTLRARVTGAQTVDAIF